MSEFGLTSGRQLKVLLTGSEMSFQRLSGGSSGAVDGYFETGLKEWDLAAGGLIAREAGALVTGRNGTTPGEEMVIAAGPALHAILVAEIG